MFDFQPVSAVHTSLTHTTHTPPMTSIPSFTYNATVLRVVDGDTIDVDMDLGMRCHFHARLRIAHIDAPENSTPEGKVATGYVRELLPIGVAVVVATSRPDKYGRALADVTLPDGRDLASEMVSNGHAVAYEGGPRT